MRNQMKSEVVKSKAGQISGPIRMMMDSDKYGRVTFIVSSFKQHSNTRNAALATKNRYGFDIYTMAQGCRLHVIKRGFEDKAAFIVDLREETA